MYAFQRRATLNFSDLLATGPKTLRESQQARLREDAAGCARFHTHGLPVVSNISRASLEKEHSIQDVPQRKDCTRTEIHARLLEDQVPRSVPAASWKTVYSGRIIPPSEFSPYKLPPNYQHRFRSVSGRGVSHNASNTRCVQPEGTNPNFVEVTVSSIVTIVGSISLNWRRCATRRPMQPGASLLRSHSNPWFRNRSLDMLGLDEVEL